jgi:hypothetical protein
MGKKTELKIKKKVKQKPVKPAPKAVKKASQKKDVNKKKPAPSKTDDLKKKKTAEKTPAKKAKTASGKKEENLKKKTKPAAGGKPMQNQKDFFTVDDDAEENKEKQDETDYVEETEIEFIEEGSAIEDLNNLDEDEEDDFYADDNFC